MPIATNPPGHTEKLTLDGLCVRVSTHIEEGNSSGMHYHDNSNIVFLLAGGCIEKRKHHTSERAAADILFLHAGEMHETIFAEWPTRYISLDIEPALLTSYELKESHLLKTMTTAPDAKFLMLKIYRELLRNDVFTADSIRLLFLEFAAFSKKIQRRKDPPTWIKTIHELLHDQWNENISLNDLSKAAGVNPITISKHFPAYFACTLGSYMRKLKVERSLSLIKRNTGSLTATAYACNFSDQSHFIRSFREFTSLSPRQYQKL